MKESRTIELNHLPYPYKEAMTITTLMKEKNFNFSHIIVKINGAVIEEGEWPRTAIKAEDKVEMIHVFGGG